MYVGNDNRQLYLVQDGERDMYVLARDVRAAFTAWREVIYAEATDDGEEPPSYITAFVRLIASQDYVIIGDRG